MYTRESFANVPYNFVNKNKHLNLRYNLNFESKRMIFKKKMRYTILFSFTFETWEELKID